MHRVRWSVVALVGLFTSAAHADVLTLKDGSVLQGRFQGGTATSVRFETTGGVRAVETKDITSVTFTAPVAAAPVAAAPAAVAVAPAAAPAAPAVRSIPAGTTFLVRNVDVVTSDDPAGKVFAAVLESDLLVGSAVVAKAGTRLYGKVEKSAKAGRVAGKAELQIGLTDIEIGGARVKIDTTSLATTGEGSFKKTARGAVVGMAIGGAAGGGSGAAAGAGVGAATTLLKKGQVIGVAPKSLLEFTLEQAASLPSS